MNYYTRKVSSIRKNILSNLKGRGVAPKDLREQIYELSGFDFKLAFPNTAVFLTKEERLEIAECFIALSKNFIINEWCDTYLPVYFKNYECTYLVVIDTETLSVVILDFDIIFTKYNIEDFRDIDVPFFDTEYLISSRRVHHSRGVKQGYMNVLKALAGVAAIAIGIVYTLHKEEKEDVVPLRAADVPKDKNGKDVDFLINYQLIGHSH